MIPQFTIMFLKIKILFFVSIFGFFNACNEQVATQKPIKKQEEVAPPDLLKEVVLGADQFEKYLPLLKNKKVALLVNQTSITKEGHLVDVLLQKGVEVSQIFAPEHGFRGKADAGEQVKDGKDIKTGLPIISLYGKNKKPSAEQLNDIDIVVFDIQDVGARFYTYISSMSYAMEACAENQVDFLVLDRPNPNGHYIDGPILEKEYSSFVGLHPVPIVHGMTVGEYAQMVNQEGWLKNGIQVNLQIISCQNYSHNTFYELPVKPSPNLPNLRSIYLYPTLCLFEGTDISIGRGTNKQFQVIGHPTLDVADIYESGFIPQSMEGAKYPKHEGKPCAGYDYSWTSPSRFQNDKKIYIEYWLDIYERFPDKNNFFNANNFFEKLAGTAQLRQQIVAGKTSDEIRVSWQEGLRNFQKMRAKYLLYPDFKTE